MKKLILIMMAICLISSLHVPVVASSEQTRLHAVVIPMIYEDARDFSEGMAAVADDGKWGYIDAHGNMVVPSQYDAAYPFFGGMACVKSGDKYGYIDLSGSLVIPLQYEDATSFSEGLASVVMDGKCGVINQKGEQVVPFIYDRVNSFFGGMAGVIRDGKRGYIDISGELVVPLEYSITTRFFHGLAAVAQQGEGFRNTWGFIDTSGEIVIPMLYSAASEMYNGIATVAKDNRFGAISSTGEVIVPLEYDMAVHGGHFIAVAKGENFQELKWGAVLFTGREIIPPVYDAIATNPFQSDEAPILVALGAGDEARWGYLDMAGEVCIPLSYSEANAFYEGLASVRLPEESGGGWGFIDTLGNIVVPFEYEAVNGFREGLSAIQQGGKWGYISLDSGLSDPEEMPSMEQITMTIGSLDVYRGEVQIESPSIAPMIINDRTMLPYRFLCETVLGGEVQFHHETRGVIALVNGHKIEMFIDKTEMTVDGETVELSQPPVIIESSTLVPLRAFESVVSSLSWNPESQTVTVKLNR